MHKYVLLTAIALSGCRGVDVEIYKLLVTLTEPPISCYAEGFERNTVSSGPPESVQVQVWDGPEGEAYLEFESGNFQVVLGESPSVTTAGIFTGKAGEGGWKFEKDTSTAQTQGEGANAITQTVKTHVELTFPRGGGSLSGTAALNSSYACTGASCPDDVNRSCAINSISFKGSRIAVEFEREP